MQKDPDVINIIVDETEETEAIEDIKKENKSAVFLVVLKNILCAIADFFRGLFKDISPSFIKISSMICAGIIFVALGLGFIIPKSDSALSSSLENLRETDTSYLNAKGEYDSISKEILSLTKELETKQENMNNMDKTQDSLDKIIQENDSLSKEKETLQNEINSKQRTLDNLEKSTSTEKSSIMWSSGTYKVGKNIAEGKYTVTGTGSIVIANSGNARVNTRLKSDGASYTLLDGDTIKIDGSAKFIPE